MRNFGFHKKAWSAPLNNLSLLGDRANDRFERRALVDVSEGTAFDLVDDNSDASADRPRVLQSLVPEEPAAIRAVRIVSPTIDQLLSITHEASIPAKASAAELRQPY